MLVVSGWALVDGRVAKHSRLFVGESGVSRRALTGNRELKGGGGFKRPPCSLLPCLQQANAQSAGKLTCPRVSPAPFFLPERISFVEEIAE